MGQTHKDWVNALWRGWSSLNTTALLTTTFATLCLVGVLVPQGNTALEIAESAQAVTLHRLIAWGLTDIFRSPWLWALGVLLASHLLAVFARWLMMPGGGATRLAGLNSEDPSWLHEVLHAPLPEQAVERLRSTFRSLVGAPVSEEVKKSRVIMGFETSPGAKFAPLWIHVGMMLLVLGAGIIATPSATGSAIAHAVLEVTHPQSGAFGVFDMAEHETVQFFQHPARYRIRRFVRAKDNLGPAIQMEKLQANRPPEDFWIYANAPIGFDRHRRGAFSIRALKLDRVPPPGQGVTASPGASLLLAGLALLLIGTVLRARPQGSLWIDVDGDQVKLSASPKHHGDPSFERHFHRFAAYARWSLREAP